MTKVTKDFINIPSILKSKNREEAFNKNILVGKYEYGKSLYKTEKLQEKLKNIYYEKCAYCEKKLIDSSFHIEHYRPKDKYYWLAYSWDNLFLSCSHCNTSKGTKFLTKNAVIVHTGESFSDIHNLSDDYDSRELPMIINPEKDDILNKITFDKNGIITSYDERVTYTVNIACKLNRDALIDLRMEVLNDFKRLINDYYNLFDQKNQTDNENVIKSLFPLVKKFIDDCHSQNNFYSFRYFILNNIEVYFEEPKIYNTLKYLILKLKKI